MNISFLYENIHVLLPEVILFLGALAVVVADLFRRKDDGEARGIPVLALLTVVAGLAGTAYIWGRPPATYLGAASLDGFALGVRVVVLTGAFFAILLSMGYAPRITWQTGEYYALLLLATAGMSLLGATTELALLFVALETFSLALYVLTGIYRRNPRSTEASLKYFLLGAFASGFFVYGAALLYGAGGSTDLALLGQRLAAGEANTGLLWIGMALLLVGFGFKLSLVPFHMWTPDVYQGAPTPITAFMSVGTKTAALAGFIRVLTTALPAQQATWSWALAVLAVLTMTVGNLAALRQMSLKRMLAYSSIAHAGYILVALVPGTAQGASAALFYLFAYAFMNIGAFAVVVALERTAENDVEQGGFVGIAASYPAMAAAMAVFLFRLAGIPPLAGFFGKLFVFKAAVEGGWTWLAVLGVLNSAISAYYYLRITVAMYFGEGQAVPARNPWAGVNLSIALAVLGTVLVGIYPSLWTALFRGLGG